MNKRITAGAGASLGALLALPAGANAEDFQVTNLNSSGPGSLFDAVDDATQAGPDRILFNSKLSGTITTHPAGTLYIAGGGGDLEIIGPGARKVTLTGPDGFPALNPWATFNGQPGADVTISGLRIAGSTNDGPLVFFGNSGGGLQIYGDMDVTLERVTIAGNSADGNGGGIGLLSGGETPNLVIENSTISGNSAAGNGGGVYKEDGPIRILNSTISGNDAGASGGGVYLQEASPDDEVLNSTVTGNTADGSGGGFYEDGSGATIRGSIVSGNSASAYDDLEGEPWPISFSIVGTDGNPEITNQGGNIFDVDPNLKPLKNNGGPTDTHAFKKSPAKNKGPSDAPNQDQRGAPRKGKPDIGAYELAKCEGVIVNRVGTAGKDKLKGTKKKDGILGLGGNDKLSGKKGKDGLCGGQGKDKLKGGPGKDKLNGGPGKDKEVQ